MTEEIKSEASAEVSKTDMEKALEEAMKTTEGMGKALADRQQELEELHKLVSETETKHEEAMKTVAAQVEELQKLLAAEKAARESAEAELRVMKEEALLKDRFAKLNEAGLLRSSEEARVKQGEKIKAMTEEEFASYVEELSDIVEQTSKNVSPKESAEKVAIDTKVAADEIVKTMDANAAEKESAAERIKKVLDSLLNKTAQAGSAPAEEKKEEVASKETASTKIDMKRLAEGLKQIAFLEK